MVPRSGIGVGCRGVVIGREVGKRKGEGERERRKKGKRKEGREREEKKGKRKRLAENFVVLVNQFYHYFKHVSIYAH